MGKHPVEKVGSVEALRDTSYAQRNSVHVPGKRGGTFDYTQTDPFGNGDDGGVVFQNKRGEYWVRREATKGSNASPFWWGLERNKTKEQTDVIQKSIEWLYNVKNGGKLEFPEGTFYCRNILFRDGVSIVGSGVDKTIIKMYEPEETRLKSTNDNVLSGTEPDAQGGEYSANLFSTHLTWNGGIETKQPTRTRARDPKNEDWDAKDFKISNMTLDHRWALVNGKYPTDKNGNSIGSEQGQNNSEGGACIRIVNAGHITLKNLKLLNGRHDGILAGFDENGGFDFGKVENVRSENCLRTGVAFLCGRKNVFEDVKTVKGGEVAGFDVEPNLADVICHKNEFKSIKTDEEIHLVVRDKADLSYNHFRDCAALAYVVEDAKTARGSSFVNCVALHDGSFAGAAFRFRTLGSVSGRDDVDFPKVTFERCFSVGNYEKVWTQGPGAVQNIELLNCYFEGKDTDTILYPYRISIKNCHFNLTDSTDAITLTLANASTVTIQGEIEIERNTFQGSILNYFVNVKQGSDPPSINKEDIIVRNNIAHTNSAGNFRTGMSVKIHENNSWQINKAQLTSKDTSTVDGTYGAEESSVIQNNRTRISEIESRLQSRGIIN